MIRGHAFRKQCGNSIMKKTLLAVLIIVLCVIAGLFTWKYIAYLNDPDPYKTFLLPKVGMSVIEISSLTSDKTEMKVNLFVKNNLPFSFKADSFEYQLYINDAEIIKSRHKKTIELEANDSSWISMPVTVFNHDIDSVITANEVRKNDSAEYRIRTSFYTDIFFKKRFSIVIKRYLPLIHLPELKVEKIEVDSLNFKRAALILHASIRNNNVFDLKFKDYAFEVQIGDHDWVKGKIPGMTKLKSHATTELEVPVKLSLSEVGKTLFDLLKKGQNIKYELKLSLTLMSDVDMLKNSKAVITSTGSVKSLLKAVKGKS